MKHITVLTLTALAAAASAQTEPAAKQELSYNRIVVSRVSNSDNNGSNGLSVAIQAKLGKGFYVSAETQNWGSSDNGDAVRLGYAYTLPAFGSYNADLNLEIGAGSSYVVGIRTVAATNLEVGLAYTHTDGRSGTAYNNGGNKDTVAVSGAYSLSSLTKGLTLNASYEHGRQYGDTTRLGLGYNF